MKAAIAMLLGLLLLAAEMFAAARPAASAELTQRAQCPCGCGAGTCCAAKPAHVPPPEPAAPAPSLSQNHLLLLSAGLGWTPPTTPAPREPFSGSSCAAFADAVPLFCRNCAFLI